ncbi:hypothetical protein [Nocardia sp. NBC_00511]|uniref:hypothetical protein n=1 Tax=Nocardia sp. NBC_00511 TaxID=2903591 RepID=UPI0030E090D2
MADEIQCAECSRPVGDHLTLCIHCGDRLRDELLSVPGVLADLATMRAGQAKFSGERVGGRSAESRLPVQSVARKLKDPVGAELTGDRGYRRVEAAVYGWARVLSEHLRTEVPVGARGLAQLAINNRYNPADRGTNTIHRSPDGKYARLIRHAPDALAAPATAVEQAAVWMACHPHELRAHEAARDMLTEIAGALEELRKVVDRPLELNYLGPCPTWLDSGYECGFVLRAERGQTSVRCGRCREQFDVSELQAKARLIAEDKLYTLAEMRGVLAAVGVPVSKQTLHWWANGRKTDRLEPRGWQHVDDRGTRITDHQISDRDKQVYRLGDALKLAQGDEKQGGSAAWAG